MIIEVAGVRKEVADRISLTELITIEAVENPEYVAVAVNNSFIDSALFSETQLSEDDTVEFLYFMGGGNCLIAR